MKTYRLVLNVTNTCNMKCFFCYRASANTSKKDHMSIENAKTVMDLVYNDDRFEKDVQFLGAEPTMNMEVVKYVMDNYPDCNYEITTNGYFVNDESNIPYMKRMNRVTVSIESTEALFNKVRGGKNLHDLVDKVLAMKHPNCSFSITANKDFFNNIEEFIPLYNKIMSNGYSISFKQLDAVDNGFVDTKDYLTCLKILKELFHKNIKSEQFDQDTCALDRAITVQPDLSVLPCHGFAGHIDLDLKITEIPDILFAVNEMADMFAVHKDRPLPMCNGCILENKYCRNRCSVSGGIPLYVKDKELFEKQCEMRIIAYLLSTGEIEI